MNRQDRDIVIIILLVLALIFLGFYSIIIQTDRKYYEGIVTKINGNNITFDAITFHCISISSTWEYYIDKEIRFEYYIKDGLCYPCSTKEL